MKWTGRAISIVVIAPTARAIQVARTTQRRAPVSGSRRSRSDQRVITLKIRIGKSASHQWVIQVARRKSVVPTTDESSWG